MQRTGMQAMCLLLLACSAHGWLVLPSQQASGSDVHQGAEPRPKWLFWSWNGPEQAGSTQANSHDSTRGYQDEQHVPTIEEQRARAAELLFGQVNVDSQYDPGQLMATSMHQQQMLQELDALDTAASATADYADGLASSTATHAGSDVGFVEPQLEQVDDFRGDVDPMDEQFDVNSGAATNAMGEAADAAYESPYDDRLQHMLWVTGTNPTVAAASSRLSSSVADSMPAASSSSSSSSGSDASSGGIHDLLILHHYLQDSDRTSDSLGYQNRLQEGGPSRGSSSYGTAGYGTDYGTAGYGSGSYDSRRHSHVTLLLHPVHVLASLLEELLLRADTAFVMHQAHMTRPMRLWGPHATTHAGLGAAYDDYYPDEYAYTYSDAQARLADVDLDAADWDSFDDWGAHPLAQPSNYQYVSLSAQPDTAAAVGVDAPAAEPVTQPPLPLLHRCQHMDVGLLLLLVLLCATGVMVAGFVRNFVSLRRAMGSLSLLGQRREVLVPMVLDHDGRQYIVLLDESQFAAAAGGAWAPPGKAAPFGSDGKGKGASKLGVAQDVPAAAKTLGSKDQGAAGAKGARDDDLDV